MTELMSLLKAAAKFELMRRDMEAIGPAIVEEACRMVHKEARRVLGTYDYGWKKLSSSTVSRKGKDTPGVSTGEMRNSIQWTAKGLEGQVGSNDQKAVWFELGTKKQPPRSFLVGAVRAKARDVQKMAGQSVAAVMGAHHLLSPEMRHLVHDLKKIGHKAKELGEEVLEKDEGHQ